ncbi:exodeoxyribonuclease V subunit beta [Rhodohalobacter sp. SW132]|uniref:exodeoxyribonuclease V subunit beta n=1 Tax=Rhodohalobacter sp. SW132 TaxID=2293433 RepID=UPI000E253942|nr:exodeoxyribonuclease V subunit beta [Rhodohalobacter sp. SW132]REL33649.1 exodeoxyribonuclease V subunit beta [Rhodohalobacter sp. SW132]
MREELNQIFDLEFSPRVLVEASAGTGKTYTIVGIFIRLLLERELDIEQILTVTFTKKATAELRERILERLRQTLDTVEGSDPPGDKDPFLSEIYSRYGKNLKSAEALRRAMHNFDDCQVFTIHGFCQKILQEEALIAGTPFELNVSPTDQLLMTAADDYWRTFMHENSGSEAGHYLISKLTSIAATPGELISYGGIKPLIDKPYATAEGEFVDDPKAILKDLIDLKADLKNLWHAEKETILKIMRTCDLSGYAQHVDSRIRKFEFYLYDRSFSQDKPDALVYLTSDYVYDDENLRKNGNPVPEHPFFDLCSELAEKAGEVKKVQSTLLIQAFREISERRKELTAESEISSYDDLLTNIHDSLITGENSAELSGKLRKRYPVALVDEFQDTDPIQYEIFSKIYPAQNSDSSLMMIGDPKQAIYAFRGADLHTYFRARKDGVGSDYTLTKNYRSTTGYIRAVNELFSGERNAFIEEEIEFRPSEAGRENHTDSLVIRGESVPSLSVIARSGIDSNKGNACSFAFSQTVKKIGEILGMASRGEATIGDRPVRAGDITILISRHKDAKTLQRKLKQIGIDSVTKTNQTIFETVEATKLEIVMNAVLNPLNSRAVHALLLTGMFGQDLNRLHNLTEDEERYQSLSEELMELNSVWKRRGFYAMFYEIIHKEGRLANLASLEGSERIITNLYHLAEVCAQEERINERAPRMLHRWLLRQMDETEREEEKELQLESDQHLVKIMTVHASKGLQFPLVFCPTLWMGHEPSFHKNKIKSPVEYHKPGESELYINIEREKSERRKAAETAADLESIAEEVRKTYVALTRAEYGSFVFWSTHTESLFSGLGAALSGTEKTKQFIEDRVKLKDGKEPDEGIILDRFKELSAVPEIGFEIIERDEPLSDIEITQPGAGDEIEFEPYIGRETLQVKNRVESFSSLAGHSSDPAEPDFDQVIEQYSEAFEPESESEKSQKESIFQFPKGATAGTAIHKLFEHESFDFSEFAANDFGNAVEELLEEYQFDLKWKDVILQMLSDVTGAEIPGFSLNKLRNDDQIRELEFHFPAAEVYGDELIEIIRNENGNTIPDSRSQMYLTGFIDLVARQDGKYYILDYKSNYLGDSVDDYGEEDLRHEIRANHYDLQYHLYTVALLAYLRTRVPGFSYENDFGGVAYLFVRGMKPGSSNGVWFHKPDLSVIQKLEQTLGVMKSEPSNIINPAEE